MISSELDRIVPFIARVVDGENLSAKESEEVFTTLFLHDKKGFHFATFVAAIHAKGETPDELLGLSKTSEKMGAKLRPKVSAEKITDLSGTGGGSLKTFNVSTTASFVVAAAGYTVAKEAFYAVTSPTGSADLFAAFGVDIAKLSKEKIEKTLEEVGICPVYLPFISPKLRGRGTLFKKAFIENRIMIRSPFHLVSNVYSPIPMKYRIYGCYSERYLKTLGELFSKLGYKRTLVFHGADGLPEISNIGKTIVVEQRDRKLRQFLLNPSDLGVRKAKKEEIKTGGKEQNIVDFLRILQGKERGAKSDLVAVNAAASLYVMSGSGSIADYVPQAKEIIKSGEGFRALERLARKAGEPSLLNKWLQQI